MNRCDHRQHHGNTNPFRFSTTKTCHWHPHFQTQYQLPCGQTFCMKCLETLPLYANNTYSYCDCGGTVSTIYIDELLKSRKINPFIQLSPQERKRCQTHTAYKTVYWLCCGYEFCWQCLYMMLDIQNWHGHAIRCPCQRAISRIYVKDALATFEEKLTVECAIVEISAEETQVCVDHEHFQSTQRLPCGHVVCLECLFDMEATFNTIATKRPYSSCHRCGQVVLTASVKDVISKIKKVDILPVHFTGTMCGTHKHNEICITMPCKAAFCLVCVIRMADFRMPREHFVNGKFQPAIRCSTCNCFIANSVLEKTLEELGNQVRSFRSPFQITMSGERCHAHQDLEILACLPCGRKVCCQCLCDMEKQCRHISEKRIYVFHWCSCMEYIWKELVTDFITRVKVDTDANSMSLMSNAEIERECYCVEHKHSKYLALLSTSKRACFECLLKMQNETSGDTTNKVQKMLDKIDIEIPKRLLNPCQMLSSAFNCEVHQESKIQAFLPCNSYLCKDCLAEMSTCGEMFCKCLCGEDILCSFIAETFKTVKEKDERKQNERQQLTKTVEKLFEIKVEEYCSDHKHTKAGATHVCGHRICYKCCPDQQNDSINKGRKQNKVVCPGCKEFIDDKDIRKCIKLSKTGVEESSIKIIESFALCQSHKHSQICAKFSCGRELCFECLVSLGKAVKARKKTICRECRDVLTEKDFQQCLPQIPDAIKEAKQISKPESRTKCDRHSKEAIGAFPCGENLCHQCFEDLIGRGDEMRVSDPARVSGPKTVNCKKCNTRVPANALKEYWETYKASEGIHFERVQQTNMCVKHKHHKVCTKNKGKAQCKICMKDTLRDCPQNPCTFILDYESRNMDEIDTLFGEISETELLQAIYLPSTCSKHHDKEFENKATVQLPCQLVLCFHCVWNLLMQHETDTTIIRCPKCNDGIPIESLKSFSKNITRQFYLDEVSSETAPPCTVHSYWKICCKLNIGSKGFCIFCIKDENMCRESGVPPEEFVRFKKMFNIEKKYRSYTTLKWLETNYSCEEHKHWKVVCMCPRLCLHCIENLQSRTIQINNEDVQIVLHDERNQNKFFLKNAVQHVAVENGMMEIKESKDLACTSCRKITKTAEFYCGANLCVECYQQQKRQFVQKNGMDERYDWITCIKCQDVIPCQVLDSFFTENKMMAEEQDMDVDSIRCQHKQHRTKANDESMVICKITCGHWYCSRCITLIAAGSEQYCSICGVRSFETDNIWKFDNESTGGQNGKDIDSLQSSEASAEKSMMWKETDLGGVPNIGLTCYANSIFQILCQTPGFPDALKTVTHKNTVSTMLLRVLTDIAEARDKCYTSRREHVYRLMAIMFQRNRSFALFHQNDCHSFLISLLNELSDESKSAQGKEQENPTALFAGNMANIFSYSSCDHVDGWDEEDSQLFFSLLVPITWPPTNPTIEQCLQETMKTEQFCDNKLPCRKCNKPGTITTKKFGISKLPKIMILQIQRFQEVSTYYGKWFMKNETPVEIKETLSVEKMGIQSTVQKTYKLYGVVLHIGSMEGGHYYSLVRKANTTQWYKCSDSAVHQVKDTDIFVAYYSNFSHYNVYAREAYLLFYKEVDDIN